MALVEDVANEDEYYEQLISEPDKQVLKNLSEMGKYLKQLRVKMFEAETEYERCKKEYEYYASTILPAEMFNVGVTDIKLIDGSRLFYKKDYYCSPNKNDNDKKVIADWLREHGGEDLIKESAIVDGKQLSKLKETDIPYVEVDNINTQSLKAFLKSKLGISKGSIQQIKVEDIPACIHFQEVGVAEVVAE